MLAPFSQTMLSFGPVPEKGERMAGKKETKSKKSTKGVAPKKGEGGGASKKKKHSSPSVSLNAISGLVFADATDPDATAATVAARQNAEARARSAAQAASLHHDADGKGHLFPFTQVFVSDHVIVNQARPHAASMAPFTVIACAMWHVHFACIELPALHHQHVSTRTQAVHTPPAAPGGPMPMSMPMPTT
jgi:hypothetical protein